MEATEKHCNRHHNENGSVVTTGDKTKTGEEVAKRDTKSRHIETSEVKTESGKRKGASAGNHGNKNTHNGFRRPRASPTQDDATTTKSDSKEKEILRERKEENSVDVSSLSEFVQTLELEAEKLANSAESRDTTNLRRLLADLSYTLENRQAESMKICGDADEVRRRLETVRKVLQDQINIGNEENTSIVGNDKDNKVSDTKAQVSLNHARAALARLALEVSQTSQLAAEVELAAAQAAVMAEEAEREAGKVDDVITAENGKTETDGAAEAEEDEHSEEEEVEKKQDEMKEGKSEGKDEDDEEENSGDKDASHVERNEGTDTTDEGGKESIDSSGAANESSQQKSRDDTDITCDVKNEDNESNEQQSKSPNRDSRPSSSKSRPSSQSSKHDETTELTSPRPSSSRSSQRSEKPLEWPHYPLYLSQDEDDPVIGCVIRSNDDVMEENPNMFVCRIAHDLSSTVVADCEELVSDVIVLEAVTSEEDYINDNDFEEHVDEEEEDITEEDDSDKKENGGIAEEDKEQNRSEDQKEMNKEEKTDENKPAAEQNNKEADAESEEGTDESSKISATKETEYRLVIAIPYTVTQRMASTRELVLKMKKENESTWSILPTLAQESFFPEHKGPFMEVRANRCAAFAVVARPLTDRATITKKGGSLKSSIDSRICLTYPTGISSLMTASLRVQPAEQAVTELKSRMKHCSDLIAASPILHLTHSVQTDFVEPVSMTISCPPNPYKISALAAGKTDEKQDNRSEKSTIPPSREDGVVIRSTKSSIFGGDPSEDALHLLHRPVSAKSWAELDDVPIKQIRKDVVTLDLNRPYDRLLILRMTADCRYPVENVANTFEQALRIKYSKIILAHKADDLETALVLCVPARQVEGVLRKLAADGFEAPSEMSEELPLTEGMEIEMKATGNISVVNHHSVKLVFHSQRRCVVDLRLDVANKYGNYSSSDYRGVLEFYGTPNVVLQDMEDPEEVLLREAEAKVEAKKGKKEEKKEKKGKENKEQVQNMTNAAPKCLCKLPVALPKREKEVDVTKSQQRAAITDVPGLTSNTHLQWLATELGNEWESLASYLGIKSNRLQSIKRNFPSNQEAQIFNTLLTWRSRTPKSYDKERKLLRALTRCGRYDLSEELKYRDEEMEDDDEDDNDE